MEGWFLHTNNGIETPFVTFFFELYEQSARSQIEETIRFRSGREVHPVKDADVTPSGREILYQSKYSGYILIITLGLDAIKHAGVQVVTEWKVLQDNPQSS